MKKLISLLLVVMLVLGLTACVGGGSENTKGTVGNIDNTINTGAQTGGNKGGVLNVAWVGTAPASYSPLNSGNSNYVWTTSVVEGILSRDAAGNLCPGVCDFTLSPDQLTLTLTPREGLKFHNGEPVTIDDIWASIYGNKDDKMEQNVRGLIDEDKLVMDYDNNTMTIVFTEYNANTLYYLSQNATYLGVLPKSVWDEVGSYETKEYLDNNSTDTVDLWEGLYDWQLKHIIGTGPYKIDTTRWEDGYRVCLVRNEDYVQKANDDTLTGMAGGRYAYMDEINIWYNSNESSVALGMLNGTYDTAAVSTDYQSDLIKGGMNSINDPAKNIVYIAFNTNAITMQDSNLRKAIAAALDYQTVLQILYGEGAYDLDTSTMQSSTPYYTNAFSEVDYAGASNMELAKQYLAQSAYKDQEVKFYYDNTQGDLAAYVEQQMKALGVTYSSEAAENKTWKSNYAKTGTFDFDFIITASVQAEPIPSSMVTNLRVRFWECNENAKSMFNAISASICGSDESLGLWEDMLEVWTDDAHIVPLGCKVSTWYSVSDLTVQYPGAFVAFYNCYWEDPAAHPVTGK